MKPSAESHSGIFPYPPIDWEHEYGMVRGATYKVIREFEDVDGDLHPIDSEWKFEGAWFSKFDNWIELFFCRSDETHWHVALDWSDEGQAKVIENPTLFMQQLL